ncbi:YbhN family protein [Ramlibacter sp. AN1015]|uniref:lysylphosphatidylglycerol synthase transmembrane domain-containing protein n=1 Tax=Ramlibacter sp. AN1015 TaxID=3133428 RepID=UPI0030BCC054
MSATPEASGSSGAPQGGWWAKVKRLLTFTFFAAVTVFVVRYARNVEWAEVWSSIAETPWQLLSGAAALSALSYTLYSCFDLLGRHYTGHTLPTRRVMKINFISYAFNLNLGAVVGAVAFRFRLYSRLGLDNATIGRVVSLSLVTNWLGYLLLAGGAFVIAPLQLPPHWKLDMVELRWLGVALLAVVALYVALCLWSPRRSFTIRGHELLLPPRRMVPLQLAMSCANWMMMAGVVYLLLRRELPYAAVLNVLLVAAIAGVITHVPAGIGVLEGVFVALLSHRISEWQLLAALLSYRALYYMIPLLVAALLYLWFEARVRVSGRSARGSPAG